MAHEFQKMIDDCESKLIVPVGQHITGTLHLKSNMELHLPAGAEILGSLSIKDYPYDYTGIKSKLRHSPALIVAENQENITFSGNGVIDGRGSREAFPAVKPGDELDRPMLLRFSNCKNVYLRDVHFNNSASWGLHFIDCENVHIDGICMDSVLNRNNDGLDLDGCRDVFISNCRLRTGDDAICPKSTVNVTENVVITNCIISSRTAAFKLGTSSAGGFRNITLSNCVFRDCKMGAIKLLCVDGGILENIMISDVVMDRVEGPIFIRLGDRGKRYAGSAIHSESTAEEEIAGKAPAGILRNVTISNIRAHVETDDRQRSGIMITGVPGRRVEDIRLRDVYISFPGGGTAEEAQIQVAEDEARYPEQFFFGTLPSWGCSGSNSIAAVNSTLLLGISSLLMNNRDTF